MQKFLFFIFIFLSFRLFAQTNAYHPFPDSNAHWSEYAWWVNSNQTVNDIYTLFLFGDTIIGAKSYHKIFKSGYLQALSPPQYYYNKYMGGLRQDIAQKKIFFVSAGLSEEELLYDFNLNVGDTLPPSYNQGQWVYVSNIDSVLVESKYYKRFKIKPFHYWPTTDTNHAIIEGIGSTFGLYNEMNVALESGERFRCFRHNATNYPTNDSCTFATEVITFTKQDFNFKIFPNPSTGIFSISSSEKFQFSVYDIFGKEVFQSVNSPMQSATVDMSSYPKGIYFVRGRSEDRIFSKKIILQ